MYGLLKTFATLLLAISLSTWLSPVEARMHNDHQVYLHRTTHTSKSASHSRLAHGQKHRKHKGRVVIRLEPQVGKLVVTENGETLLEELADVEFNPASVAKLVTAYGAIKTFGLEHRFNTRVLLSGELDQLTGAFNGDVYIDGADPDFDRIDALCLNKQLLDNGIKRVNGRLIVSPGFSYACCADSGWSGRSLVKAWSRGKSIPVTRGVSIGQAPQDAQLLFEQQSEPLRETLKEMLSYSQNHVAEQIGRVSGGPGKLAQIAAGGAGLEPGSIKLASASGLGRSRVKPKDMMLVLKALRLELQSNGLDLKDICPVAGVDPGTLDERFTNSFERGSVVGKTGTLPGTDGGTSTLVGMFRTQKEDVYFVIFCWHGNVVSFRHQQDELIRKLQSSRGGPKPFEYGQVQTPGA